MSKVPPPAGALPGPGASTAARSASASGTEKAATSPSTTATPATASAPRPKVRSCAVCRTRKVRCDKQSPCSNCRRANIPCVVPSADRPPRWARRLERITASAAASAAADSTPAPDVDPGVSQVMERLRSLESLVKDLSGQLEQAQAAALSTGSSPRIDIDSPGSSTHGRDADHRAEQPSTTSAGNVQQQFGRLVLNDASKSRYVSSGFWSRVNDELDALKKDTRGLAGTDSDSDTSDDEASPGKYSSTQELERTPSERHAFLFRHNLNPSGSDLRQFQPLPSQVPFLLDVFSENINTLLQIVHMPTVNQMARSSRAGSANSLTPVSEALMFSIYYAAVTSMEEDDVAMNFGATKTDLNLKYRLGLEYALAKADFLNVPDIVLVQAFAIFLFLVRLHDSPRFGWMMTGLVIRMAQALGMHRDGSHFGHLTPFEVEMRRRVWWALCALDMRASDDQGSDITISSNSFDTRLPLNINDADFGPDTKEMPPPREGFTDATVAIVSSEICAITRRMTVAMPKGGPQGLEQQTRLLNEMYEVPERNNLEFPEGRKMMHWVLVRVVRVTAAKMTLITHLPVLFATPSEHFSDEIRDKLLVSAIEVAENNHVLHAEPACRPWRWIFQTYTQWHAIVYILIEISQRPWSPTIERAYLGLQSPWLIPAQSNMDKNLRIWFPLRKLVAKARRHRAAELERLRGNAWAAQQLEAEDGKLPVPLSDGPLSAEQNVEYFRERWRMLIAESGDEAHIPVLPSTEAAASLTAPPVATEGQHQLGQYGSDSSTNFQPAHISTGQGSANPMTNMESAIPWKSHGTMPAGQAVGAQPTYNAFPSNPIDWARGPSGGGGIGTWLWADADSNVDIFGNLDVDANDLNMDFGGEVDWNGWVESAKGMEWDVGTGNGGLN
ncbi:Uu.00g006870.m01.CDS01 [Anthostomella pinea]|uniref:Uu.00g006870.m01.CDS01 n=1 Tax=Anthostomella pinea TaxID=933095 RepID=A0AAI8YJ23_9PEZI|nr:Uu.00g006870.m01.CDS01 [Anthostomella pinea]